VRFAEERFADESDASARRRCFNRCAQSRAASANDEDVMRVSFEFSH
jgi:hypothetical protein